jgi:hypothetical protein
MYSMAWYKIQSKPGNIFPERYVHGNSQVIALKKYLNATDVRDIISETSRIGLSIRELEESDSSLLEKEIRKSSKTLREAKRSWFP